MTEEPKRPTFLNLDDLAPEAVLIQIGGKKYALRRPESFGLQGAAELAQLEKRFAAAQERFEANMADLDAAAEVEATLNKLIELLIEELSAEAIAALPFAKRVRVLTFFEECYPELIIEARLRYGGNRQDRRSQRTGAKSSRGSRSGTGSHSRK